MIARDRDGVLTVAVRQYRRGEDRRPAAETTMPLLAYLQLQGAIEDAIGEVLTNGPLQGGASPELPPIP